MTPNIIDEKTKLPLSLIIGLVLTVVSIVAWGASMETKLSEHGSMDDRRVYEIQAKQDKIFDALTSIDQRLSRIEGRITGGE